MQLTGKRYTLSTFCQMVITAVWPPTQHAKLVSLQSNLYRTLSQLPMGRFLTALCDNDLQALVISGPATPGELRETWHALLNEYFELKNDIFKSEEFQLSKDITRLQNHLFLLQQCIDFLYTRHSASVAQSLNKLGYTFRPATQEPEDYRPLLDTIVARSKTKYIQVKQLIARREKVRENTKNVLPTREYFEQVIVNVESVQKTTYDLETITVSKFVQLEKRYAKYVQTVNDSIQKNKKFK